MPQLDRKEKVWAVVKLIPEGHVASYGQVADLAGWPGRARMVSKCLSAYSGPSLLPWHRVLRSSGEIAFPVGSEMAKEQTQLLLADGVMVANNRVKMKVYQWQPDLSFLLHHLEF